MVKKRPNLLRNFWVQPLDLDAKLVVADKCVNSSTKPMIRDFLDCRCLFAKMFLSSQGSFSKHAVTNDKIHRQLYKEEY